MRSLFHAARSGDLAAMMAALSAGECPEPNGQSLAWAAFNGHREAVSLLLDHGAKAGANDNLALIMAAGSNKLECVQLLVQRGANVQARDNEALRQAVFNGRAALADLLLELGANPDDAPAGSQTASEIAQSKGLDMFVSVILRHQAKRRLEACVNTHRRQLSLI